MNWRGEYVCDDAGRVYWLMSFHMDSPLMRDAVCFGMMAEVVNAAQRGVKVGSA
jgi:hypothetical protein